jgi:hypothetical protein
MINILTTTEINDLKAIRATYIVDADLTELKAFFAKYSMAFSLDKNTNIERTFSIMYDNFTSSRLINGFTDAYILRIYNIAKNTDLGAAIKAVRDKAFTYMHNFSFESERFILENNFDFKAYQTVNNDVSLVNRDLGINVIIGTTRV